MLQPAALHAPALAIDQQIGLFIIQPDQRGIKLLGILIKQLDHRRVIQASNRGELTAAGETEQADTGRRIAIGLIQRRLITPDAIELHHGLILIVGLLDILGKAFHQLGIRWQRYRHLDSVYQLLGQEPPFLPAKPAGQHHQRATEGKGRRSPESSLRGAQPHGIKGGLDQQLARHLGLADTVGTQQRPFADQVDDAGNAATEPVQLLDGACGEDRLHATGHLQTKTHIGIHIGARQRHQVITGRDALGQLSQHGLTQQLLQLGLTNQHHLQQLGLVGLQIGQQAQLLQHIRSQMLSLVDEQQGLATGMVVGNKEVAEQIEELLDAIFRLINQLELITDGGQQFALGEGRIEHQSQIRGLR